MCKVTCMWITCPRNAWEPTTTTIIPTMHRTKFNWKSPFSKNVPVMTTFSQDIKSSIILYNFTSSSFCLSMTRSGSSSSKPVLCGCAQVVSCADSLLYSPAHWQPRRAYGQRTSLKYTPTSTTTSHDRATEGLQRGNANTGTGPGRDGTAAGVPSLAAHRPHTYTSTCNNDRLSIDTWLTSLVRVHEYPSLAPTHSATANKWNQSNGWMDGRLEPTQA